MSTTMELKNTLESCIFSCDVMKGITSYLDSKGYTYQSTNDSEIVISDCTKEAGKKLVEEATKIDGSKIKKGFQMVANRNNLYIRKKYKKQPLF